MIGLGDKARDQITGFEGVVTGRCTYISGCDQILLAPKTPRGGDYKDSHWFDIDRCVLVKKWKHAESRFVCPEHGEPTPWCWTTHPELIVCPKCKTQHGTRKCPQKAPEKP